MTHLFKEKDTFPQSIEGIDIESGLKHISGNKKLFLKLLKDFHTDHQDDISLIKGAIDLSDHALCERLTHTIKGVAGTIGAEALHKSAATLEAEVKNKKINTSSVDAFEIKFEAIMNSLKALFEIKKHDEISSSNVIDIQEIIDALNKVKISLEEFSPDAEALVENLKEKLLGSPFEELAGKLLTQASYFEFDDAQETCIELENRLRNEI